MKGVEHVKKKDRILRRGLGTRPFRVFYLKIQPYDSTQKIQDLLRVGK